jgi:hypothetical protein
VVFAWWYQERKVGIPLVRPDPGTIKSHPDGNISARFDALSAILDHLHEALSDGGPEGGWV